MKKLLIEWQHLDVDGETCDRCYDTGETLKSEVKRLNRALNPQGVEVELIETLLDDRKTLQSNGIYFDGIPIETVLELKVSENHCASCTSLLGKETTCRTITFDGNEYEDIPAKAIRQAAYLSLGLKRPTEKSCSCNGGCCS